MTTLSATSNKEFWFGVLNLVGTVIGAGIFAIPSLMVSFGVVYATLIFVGVSLFMLLTGLLLGEVCLRTTDTIGFLGFIKKYIPQDKRWANSVVMLNFIGACIAYTYLAAHFLQGLFGVTNAHALSTLAYTILVVFVSFKGYQLIKKSDFFLTIGLLLVLIALAFKFFTDASFDIAPLVSTNPPNFIIAFGVFVFALSGISAIPPIEASLRAHEKNKLTKIIVVGSLLASVLTLLFSFAVISYIGPTVSDDVVSSLVFMNSRGILVLFSLFGLLAVITSHVMMVAQLTTIFSTDLKMQRTTMYGVIYGLPLVVVVSNIVNLTSFLHYLGVLLGGLVGIIVGRLVLAIHTQGPHDHGVCVPYARQLSYIVIIGYLFAMIYEVFRLFA